MFPSGHMRIAVVGPRGFVGSKICSESLKRGWSVLGIDRNTPDKINLLEKADAVAFAVGSFSTNTAYKSAVNSTLSPCALKKLVSARFDSNPLQSKSLLELNYAPVVDTVKLLAQAKGLGVSDASTNHNNEQLGTSNIDQYQGSSKIPFVYISANPWALSSTEYIDSKRQAEHFLASKPYLRAAFVRPKFIRPDVDYRFSVRDFLDLELKYIDPKCTSQYVAEKVCDAIESGAEGPINL